MYLNREERECFLMLQAAKAAIQVSMGVRKFQVDGGAVMAQMAIDSIDAWCERILEPFSDEVKHSLYTTAKESRMRIVGRVSNEATVLHTLAPVEPFERLVRSVVMDCAGCMYEEKEIKKCQRRRDLIACGIAPKFEEKGECGFESGLIED